MADHISEIVINVKKALESGDGTLSRIQEK